MFCLAYNFADLPFCGYQEKKSLYASPDEFQSLIKQVLSWDIRSLSQRSRPHNRLAHLENGDRVDDDTEDLVDGLDESASFTKGEGVSLSSGDVIYHLILEGLNVSYRIDFDGNVLVEQVIRSPHIPDSCTNTANI